MDFVLEQNKVVLAEVTSSLLTVPLKSFGKNVCKLMITWDMERFDLSLVFSLGSSDSLSHMLCAFMEEWVHCYVKCSLIIKTAMQPLDEQSLSLEASRVTK